MSSETQPPPAPPVAGEPQPPTTTPSDFTASSFLSSINGPEQVSVENIACAFNVVNGRLKELEQTISLLLQNAANVGNRLDFQQKILDVAAASVELLTNDVNQIKRDKARNRRKHNNSISPR